MTALSHQPGNVLAAIRAQLPSLMPTEQAVARVFLDKAAQVVELSSQQIADLAGASRATVVRSCQSLGFSGYQQLRVLIARDASISAADSQGSVSRAESGSAISTIRETFSHVQSAARSMTALLSPKDVDQAVSLLARARRVLVSGYGLSAPLALDAAARLTAVGCDAAFHFDATSAQIAARLAKAGDVILLISGSGANEQSLKVAEAGRRAGAKIVAVTSFTRTPLGTLADIELVVGMPEVTFADEVTQTSRIPQTILLEGLVSAVATELGEESRQARHQALEIVSDNLSE